MNIFWFSNKNVWFCYHVSKIKQYSPIVSHKSERARNVGDGYPMRVCINA